MHRLFVGLRPPAAARAILLSAMAGVPGARWQDDDQLHVTLRFIGEIGRPIAEDVAAALSEVHAPAPAIAIAGVGRFERRGRTTTLWAGVAPAEPLNALHHKIDAALVRAGLPPERRAYRPHVTLARLNVAPASTERFLAEQAGLRSAPFAPSSFILFESRLGRDGARYDEVARYLLGRRVSR